MTRPWTPELAARARMVVDGPGEGELLAAGLLESALAEIQRLAEAVKRAEQAEAEAGEQDEYLHRCTALLGDAGILIGEGPVDGIVKVIDQRDALQARLDAAVEALQEHGSHDGACPAGRRIDDGPCDCGLDAAIAATLGPT